MKIIGLAPFLVALALFLVGPPHARGGVLRGRHVLSGAHLAPSGTHLSPAGSHLVPRYARSAPRVTLPEGEMDYTQLDSVELCIVACTLCYQKEDLLACANNVCLGSAPYSRKRRDLFSQQDSVPQELDCPTLKTLKRK